MIAKKDPFATISEAMSGRGSRTLMHDKSIGSMADSNAYVQTSARGSPSKMNNDRGAYQPQIGASQDGIGIAGDKQAPSAAFGKEGIGSIADIDTALNTAFLISKEQHEVGPQLMQDLYKFNKRYLNQK